MKVGVVPYWSCGGEILTRALDAVGRFVARPVSLEDAQRLIAFYGDTSECSALRRAVKATDDWRRAGTDCRSTVSPPAV